MRGAGRRDGGGRRAGRPGASPRSRSPVPVAVARGEVARRRAIAPRTIPGVTLARRAAVAGEAAVVAPLPAAIRGEAAIVGRTALAAVRGGTPVVAPLAAARAVPVARRCAL